MVYESDSVLKCLTSHDSGYPCILFDCKTSFILLPSPISHLPIAFPCMPLPLLVSAALGLLTTLGRPRYGEHAGLCMGAELLFCPVCSKHKAVELYNMRRDAMM